MKRLILLSSLVLALVFSTSADFQPSKPVQLNESVSEKYFQFPFSGQWLPDINPLHVGAKNYTQLDNLRYTDTGIETVEGYSKITTNAITGTPINGFHFRKNEESHFITKALVGDEYHLIENTTAIPSTGDYTGSASSLIFSYAESDVSWDFTTDAEDATPDADGDWSDQYTTVKHAGTYGIYILGSTSHVIVKGIGTALNEISFDMYFRSSDVTNTYIAGFYSSANGDYDYYLSTDSDSTLKIYYNGAWVDTGYALSVDTWYKISGSIVNGESISVSVDDDEKYSFSGNVAASIDYIELSGPSASNYNYFDDINVYGIGQTYLDQNTIQNSTLSSGDGSFSGGPAGTMLYADTENTLIYGGDELKPSAFLVSTSATATDSVDYTDKVSNDFQSEYAQLESTTPDAYTMMLLHMDGADGGTTFTDATSRHTVANGGGSTITTEVENSKWGQSAFSANASDNLTTADSADFAYGSGRFTIDLWLKMIGTGSGDINLYYQFADADNKVNFRVTDEGIDFSIVTGGVAVFFMSKGYLSLADAWHHFALIRGWNDNDDLWAITVDGNAVVTKTYSGSFPDLAAALQLMVSGTTVDFYVDEYRISKGVARWTSNFTPSSTPYNLVGQYAFIGTPLKISEIRPYISESNATSSSVTIAPWTGDAWTSVTTTDGTSSGGIALSQTGTISFDGSDAKPKYMNGVVLYWYRLALSAGSATTYKVTVHAPMQSVKDLWNGSERTCIALQASRSGVYEDYTYPVAERSTTDSPFVATIGGLQATDAIYVMFDDRVMGFNVSMLGSFVNSAAAAVSGIGYWNGSGYVNVNAFNDGTLSGSSSFAKSGVISWSPINEDLEQPKEEFGRYGYSYRISLSGTLTDGLDYTATTISFANGDNSINDSAKGFPEYQAGMTLMVSGSASNSGTHTIISASSGKIIVPDTITLEVAGPSVTLVGYTNKHEGTSVDFLTGIAAPVKTTGYNLVGFYSGRTMLVAGNRVDYSLPDAPWIYNGVNTSDNGNLSLYFGDQNDITATHSLFNRYGSNIIESWVVTKKSETYMLTGSQPYFDFNEPFVKRTISNNLGCPAPMTMRSVEIGYEVAQEARRNALIWLDSTGPVLFDGAIIAPITGIENYFDPTKSEYIKQSLIGIATAYYDSVRSEYNLIFASGSAATENNVWLVYDLKRRRWFRKVPEAYPIYTTGVKDTNGTKYNYGHLSSGHLMRLDNTQTWDGTAITQTVTTGEFSPPVNDDLGFWSYSEMTGLKLVSEAITEDADVNATITGDGSLESQSISIGLDSGGAVSRNQFNKKDLRFQDYIYKVGFTTATSSDKWEPLMWGYKARMIRED